MSASRSRVQCPLLRKFLDQFFHRLDDSSVTEFNTLATASLIASDNDCTSRLVAFRRPLASSFDRPSLNLADRVSIRIARALRLNVRAVIAFDVDHALAWDCDLDLGMGQSLPTSSLIPRTFNPG